MVGAVNIIKHTFSLMQMLLTRCFTDTSKARSVEHHKMTQKKIRIDKIIDRLKEKGIIVTQTHLQDGIFPWRTVGGSGSFVIT